MRVHRYRPAGPALLAALLVVPLTACAVVQGGAEPAAEPLPPWAWEMPRCASYQPEQYVAAEHRISAEVTVGGAVTEVYQAGWGDRAVAEIREVVRACAHFEYGRKGDPDEYREQNAVVETGFSGDESLLVETVRMAPPAPPRTFCTMVVRDGDVVTTTRLATCDAGRA